MQDFADNVAAGTATPQSGSDTPSAEGDGARGPLTAQQLDSLAGRLEALRETLNAKQQALAQVLARNEELKRRLAESRATAKQKAEAATKRQTERLEKVVRALAAAQATSRQEALKATLTKARTTANERLAAARQTLTDKNAFIATRAEAHSALFDKYVALRDNMVRMREAYAENVGKYRATIAAKTELYSKASPYLAIYRQGLLSDEITRSGLDFSADCYIALLPSSVPAALQLKRAHGGMVVCDCVENVDVDKHSIAPNIHPPALELVNLAAYGALTESDLLLTIGNALGRTLTRFCRPVQVIPNFRRYEEAAPVGRLRAECGLGPGDVLLFASGNVVVGFEPVLEALARLPANVHLAALVRLKPAEYEARMLARVADLGLGQRVHFFPFVPYDELASVAADADVGLITSDVTNPNGAVALPNRLFDYLTAGLPVVVPPMPDVVELVQRHGFGRHLQVVTADNWHRALTQVLADLPGFKAAALAARRKITWESNEEALFNSLGRPRRVTMIGFRDLTRYQRFQRMAATLTARGTLVKAVCLSVDPAPNSIPGAEFYHFEDRYGRGVGLRRVPDTLQ